MMKKVESETNATEKRVLLSWGCGEFGQHGHGHNQDVTGSSDAVVSSFQSEDLDVSTVACGASHSLALTDKGELYSWGNGNSGQLGLGKNQSCDLPQKVDIKSSIRGISCGSRHSYAWTNGGECYSFGNNFNAQLGYDFRRLDYKENQGVPAYVDTLLNQQVCYVACGTRHSLFLFDSGTVSAVGSNNKGQLGNNTRIDSVCPIRVADLCDVMTIGCGSNHSLAATCSGSVFAWGYSKACGSKNKDILLPALQISHDHDNVIKLCGGDSHSMMLTHAGDLYTWGSNFEGQLGLGEELGFVNDPSKVMFKEEEEKEEMGCTLKDISCGENTCAALTEKNGKLFMWGINSSYVIRSDKAPRYFQYTPFVIDLGCWTVHKVACGSWHVAVIACKRQNQVIAQSSECSYHMTESFVHDQERKLSAKTEHNVEIITIDTSVKTANEQTSNSKVVEKKYYNSSNINYISCNKDDICTDMSPSSLGTSTLISQDPVTNNWIVNETQYVVSEPTVLQCDTRYCIVPICIDKSSDLIVICKEMLNVVEIDCTSQEFRTIMEFQYDKFPELPHNSNKQKTGDTSLGNNLGLSQTTSSEAHSLNKKRLKIDSQKGKPLTTNELQSAISEISLIKKQKPSNSSRTAVVKSTGVKSNSGVYESGFHKAKDKSLGQNQYHEVLIGDISSHETPKEHFANIKDVLVETKRVTRHNSDSKPPVHRTMSGRSRSWTNLRDPFNNNIRMKPVTKMQRTLSFTQPLHSKNETKKPSRKNKNSDGDHSSHLTRPKIPVRLLQHEAEKSIKMIPPVSMSGQGGSPAQILNPINQPVVSSSLKTSSSGRRNISQLNKPAQIGTPVFSSGASWRKRP